ncbi:sugar transferase [Schumannella soli]|uniref:Sugar transferase n=1 Tax=Schumannella soli TaxID=2590779 RepID=A0A506Y613_9MICO|nr:sugar transferase [Schumannella soli]TPW76458.1 sugar transferase [Schumannella soli]
MTAHDPTASGVGVTGVAGPSSSLLSSVASRLTSPLASDPDWVRRLRRRISVTDTLIVASAVITGSWASRIVEPGRPAATQYVEWSLLVLIAVGWLGLLSLAHTRDSRTVGVGTAEYRRVVTASVGSFAAYATLLALVDHGDTLPVGVGVFAGGTTALLIGRWAWRTWLGGQRAAGRYLSTAIVVGPRREAEHVIAQIESRRSAGYRVIGAAIPRAKRRHLEVAGERISLVADLETVADAAARLGVDAVIVAGIPTGDRQYIRQLSWDLEGTVTELVLASALTDVAGPRIHISPVEGLPLMHVELPQFRGARHVLKRALDIVLAGGGVLALAPLIGVIALAVRLDSPGPVLFRQERVGLGGSRFPMLKFRSMVVDAEARLAALQQTSDGNGVLFKMRADPRVTRVGRILRRCSLDELPQLFNILAGHMSLVGPRPPLPSEVEGYQSHVQRRLFIKPGLTGMWQVGGRSDLDWDESVRLDLYYVENWSITGDLLLLWRTVKVVVRGTGAY